jgi:hypothetical protein
MNRFQKTLPALGLLGVLGLISTQIPAASCFTGKFTFPSVSPTVRSVPLSCSNNTVKGTHVAEIVNSIKAVSSILTLGGAGKEAITFGIDFNGQPMSACATLDSGPADGNGQKDSSGCGPAIQWQGRLNF